MCFVVICYYLYYKTRRTKLNLVTYRWTIRKQEHRQTVHQGHKTQKGTSAPTTLDGPNQRLVIRSSCLTTL